MIIQKKNTITATNRKHHLLPTDIISHFLRTKARENIIQSLFVVIIRSFSVLSHCGPNQICEHRLFSFFLSFFSLSLFLFLFFFFFSFSSHYSVECMRRVEIERAHIHTYVCISRNESKQDRTDHHRSNNCRYSIG